MAHPMDLPWATHLSYVLGRTDCSQAARANLRHFLAIHSVFIRKEVRCNYLQLLPYPHPRRVLEDFVLALGRATKLR
jgi:hypothetical protein